jgi:superfamily II DNA or RNA helicase
VNFKSFISSINSWNDFKNVLDTKTKLEKGKAFEELTKYYLQYNPIYRTKLKQVWLHNEVPPSVLKKLNLPLNDQGIDLIGETFEGTYWAIQCKYLQDEDQRLSHRAISTFVSLSTGIAENISYCLVCTTVDDYAKIYHGKSNIGFCNSDEWRKLDSLFFDWLREKLSGTETKLIAFKPKPHQKVALKEAKDYFIKENNTRGKLVFPCGAGKSLTGYWITQELKAKRIIVAVPSLSLVKQTLEVYLRETVANNDTVSWLCVCSDEGIGKNDDVVIHTNEIGVPCVTNKLVIADWLKENAKKKTIIFTTYQSGKTIADACKMANHNFDLGIMDEAHKTVGVQDKLFSHLLFDKNITIAKRIFMTATERRYAGASDTVLSMDDLDVYGETFSQLSFKEAIEIGILSDYRIITLFISNEEVKKLIDKNAFVKPTGKEWDKETEARSLASLIALRKAMTEYPIHHAVTFHSSIKKAEAFEQSQSVFSDAYPSFSKVQSYHVSGSMPTSKRSKVVDEFAATDKGIITNAKCLTEGIDVPNIDCVLFADPRKSTVDIVQAVGRALRTKKGKDFGYVILPVFTNSTTKEEIIESAEFKEILSTLRALASNDERIIEYFKDISKGKIATKKDSLIQFDIDVQIANEINEKELIDSIQLTTWNKLAKLSWMPFEEARELVKSKNIISIAQWRLYTKSNSFPIEVPMRPDSAYSKSGWLSWGDFLGTGSVANYNRIFRSYEDSKAFVKELRLKKIEEWINYCEAGKKPEDIPAYPNQTYKNKGWKGYGEFLGTGKVADQNKKYRSFKEAKEFAIKLGLKSQKEWNLFCKSGRKPDDIPIAVSNTYKNDGWNGIEDFLGSKINYKSFSEAKQFVRNLKIKNSIEWRIFCKSGKKPFDIPSDLENIYIHDGWMGMEDFFGRTENFRSYEKAKEFAQKMKIKSRNEWNLFCKSGEKPIDLPFTLETAYKNKGWTSWGDFLGTGKIADQNKVYLNFDEVKKYVKSIGIKTQTEWKNFAKSDKKPNNIPYKVERTYKADWISWPDFLSNNNISNINRTFKPFDLAKLFVHSLNLKTLNEWKEFCKSGKKPEDIPSNPNRTYQNTGWKGYRDWLGNK